MCPPVVVKNDVVSNEKGITNSNSNSNSNSNNHWKEEEDALQTTIRGTNINNDTDLATQKPVSFLKLIALAYPERYLLFVAVICMILAEGLALINPLIIANAYDALINPIWNNTQRMTQINQTMTYVLTIQDRKSVV